ncbi:AAA family ATPase [Actinoplanes sp. NPDC051470]|uniref:AAA family ATPase n=1 Tax=Actinoplanes sp. NPDC051470 TaxID=3157224 RepID=UPI00342690E5
MFLITGAMAAGKSTVASLLAARLPKAAHVRGDAFRRMIVSGRPASADPALLSLRYRLAAMTADEYARAGYTPVVQDVILGPDLADVVAMITTRPLHVVVLAPSVSVLAAREARRAKQGYGEWTPAELDRSLREDTPRLGLWLDTSDQTPDETVDTLLANLPAARVTC